MERLKDVLQIVQALTTIAAILVAGWWFLIRGEGLPRAEIAHEFYSGCLNSDVRWVRAFVKIKNIGQVPLYIGRNEHHVARVFPVERKIREALRDGRPIASARGRIDWLELAAIRSDASGEFLEPNEPHTQYHDFLIPSNVKVLQLTSFFENPARSTKEKVVGWHAKTLHDVETRHASDRSVITFHGLPVRGRRRDGATTTS